MKFTDLEIWKKAHELTLFVYAVTKKFPKEEGYGLTSQIRRAAVSVESCIAEGFARYHFKERLNFYYDAGGSLAGIQSQTITSKDLSYLSDDNAKKISDKVDEVQIILAGLIRSTQNLVKKKKSGIFTE